MRDHAYALPLFNSNQPKKEPDMRTLAYILVLLAVALSQPNELIISAFRLFSEAIRVVIGG